MFLMDEKKKVYDRVVACLKECFLNSTPAVDIERLDHQIDPNDHVITKAKFEELLEKHHCSISDSPYLFVNKFPKIVD